MFRDLERLKEFLNAVLELPEGFRIKEIDFIHVEQVPIIDKGQKSIFDLKVKDEAGSWYIIEMQKSNEINYLIKSAILFGSFIRTATYPRNKA
ncbi:PD-(D/E)XK nuclease family transposase [Candidatus Rickettsia kedanie]|uniref:PD-(D/E)XK nuclease family transposase n=1 Tax=Candidatus Rickettsia kedanie TaxID=3115352 RepID=UPI00399C70A9